MNSFSTRTQKKFWTFSGPEALSRNRAKANNDYVSSLQNCSEDPVESLTPEEELCIVRYYEKALKEFLQQFTPRNERLPRDVKGTAFHFYKRFFAVSSVMDFHPKEIMYTCVFLSCKICEPVIPLDTFVMYIEGDSKLWKAIILDLETELLYRLSFRLSIHTPYKHFKSLITNLMARCQLKDPRGVHEHAYSFLNTMWLTDVCLLYCPSLIAFAALMQASSRCDENIDDFVVTTLLNNPPKKKLDQIVSTVRKIRSIVTSFEEIISQEDIDRIKQKLAACRNPMNDPSNLAFRNRVMGLGCVKQNTPCDAKKLRQH